MKRNQDRLKKNKTTTKRKMSAFPTGHARLNTINNRVPIIQPRGSPPTGRTMYKIGKLPTPTSFK